jgi:hypothetical protein
MKSNLRKGGTTGPYNSGWQDGGGSPDGYQIKRSLTPGGGAKEEKEVLLRYEEETKEQ